MSDPSRRIAELPPEKRALLERRLLRRRPAAAESSAIPRRPGPGPWPLSFAQQRLWFLARLEPESPVYNLAWAIRLTGSLDARALYLALQDVVARHEALRTTFLERDGQPWQRVADLLRVPLPLVDLSQEPEETREATLQAQLRAAARQPFHLDREPIVRASLFRLDPTTHVFLVVIHHIACDGWSFAVLWRELGALYMASRVGRPAVLDPLPIQYPDFAVWQRAWLQGEVLERQLAYWKRQLEGLPGRLELPGDHPRPARLSDRGNRETARLAGEHLAAVAALGRSEQATPFMVYLAAFQLLLGRLTGQADIVVGSPFANRSRPETEGLIGFFANTVPLRTSLAGQPTFRELLRRVREVTTAAQDHQDLPFERLVEELRPERSRSQHPILQIVFAFYNQPRQDLELPGLAAQRLPVADGTAKFDLALLATEDAEGLHLTAEYAADLFEPATVRRFLRHYQVVLLAALRDPEQPIGRLPLLTPAERHELLHGGNAAPVCYPRGASLVDLLRAQIERTPTAVALVSSALQLSYAELWREAERLARRLRARGVGRGQRVALCLERSVGAIVALVATLAAGAAYVPLDPDDPRPRLAELLADVQPAAVVTKESLRDRLPPLAAPVVLLDTHADATPDDLPLDQPGPEDVACVLFTSGSRGRARGVEITHRGIVRLLCGVSYVHLGPDETFLQAAPFGFDASTFEIWGPLLHGGRCVLAPERVLSVAALASLLHQHKVTTLWLTAAFFNVIVDEAPETLRGVRQLLIGGEALSVPHVRRALAQLPTTRLVNGYGPTECTTFACCYPIPPDVPASATSIPIGRPLVGTQAYVLDGEQQPVPVGVPGELYLGGDGLARGYLADAALTAARFVACPLPDLPGERLYRTGDRVRWRAEGTLEFLGRLDDQVKINGFRIEPAEVEAALGCHPAVTQAVVLARSEGTTKRLVAYVVPGPSSLDAASLRTFLAERLPAYLVPSAYVHLDALPRTANGKVDRDRLPPPRPHPPAAARSAAEPDDLFDTVLAVWKEVLGARPTDPDTSFFDQGGHSLLAVRFLARLEKRTGQRVPLADFWDGPSVRQLVAVLRRGGQAPWSPLVPVQTAGAYPPFFLVHQIYGVPTGARELARYLGPDQPVIGVQARGVDGRAAPLTSVEAMAALYCEAVQAVQPQGPYFLGGYSFGGLVAFEMAQQLVARGETVALVALFDAGIRGDHAFLPGSIRLRYLLAQLLARTRRHLGQVASLPLRTWPGYFAQAAWRLSRMLRHSAATTPAADAAACGPVRCEEGLEAVQQACLTAYEAYRPRVYPGALVYFRPRERAASSMYLPDLVWRRLAAGGLRVCRVPGDHLSFLQEPHVAIVARRLQRYLEEAHALPCRYRT